MFAALGTKVTVVEKRQRLLDFVDAQIAEGLQYHLRDLGVVFRFGETVTAVERHEGAAMRRLERQAHPRRGCPSRGRPPGGDRRPRPCEGGARGQRARPIDTGPDYRTAVEHIFAAGDVIGWPSLAATAMEQGRLAAAHAFGDSDATMNELLLFGIFATIPEISYVGRNEEELTEAACSYAERRHLALPRARPRPDPRRLLRDAEAARGA